MGDIKRILFVCSGNTCRSPMAEVIQRSKIPGDIRGRVMVSSAGTIARDGMPASQLAREVVAEMGLDLSNHRSAYLNKDLVDDSDLIVVMTRDHRDHILGMRAESLSRIIILGELDPERGEADIRDPIGRDRETYRRVRDEIDSLTDRLTYYIREEFE